MQKQKQYIVIDLKSFYASVECVDRGLDPMTTNLVVADPSRSDKTICLAITPPMKALGVKNRCRIFEIPKSVEYLIAEPRMKRYIDCSADIYGIYLNYVSKDDIHVYSIDEAFLDVTKYLELYKMNAQEIGRNIMTEIFDKTGVRATCGVGSNLYLAKVALDIMAKHSEDFIGYLDESLYQEILWNHQPITDFWRIGSGTARTLGRYGIYTMGEIARTDEDFLYKLFGIDAELLIDHAWGRESTTMEDIKSYRAKSNCLSSGQVLMCDYSFKDGELIVKEMVDLLCLEMVRKNLVTESITLQIGYSNSLQMGFARGTTSLPIKTNADSIMIPEVIALYQRIVNPIYPIRRVNICCNRVVADEYKQYSLFVDMKELERDRKLQVAMLDIKTQFGNNAVIKGMNLEEKATTMERNRQIGGHKSGE